VKRWVGDLNRVYREEPALYELDFDSAGFQWIDCTDVDHSVVSFIRRGQNTDDLILVVANFTPVVHSNYRVGAPRSGFWQELLNSDAPLYGGSGQGNFGGLETSPLTFHGHPQSLNLTLPPLAIVFFKSEGQAKADLEG
jgi:1,4-alpha-glucan branching enzyme